VNLAELAQRETAGLPNWVWAGVIVIGLGAGITINHFRSKSKSKENNNDDTSNSRNSGRSPASGVQDNYPAGDSAEGGFPIEASQTNTSLPYAGLPADTFSIVGQGGLSGIPPGMLIGNPYLDMYRHRHHKHYDRRKRRDMHEHNLEGHGQNPRGGAVAARVGSR
jgi:hypothetical protein